MCSRQRATCRNCRAKVRGCLLSILHCSTVERSLPVGPGFLANKWWLYIDYIVSRSRASPREDRVKLARDWLRRGGLARVAGAWGDIGGTPGSLGRGAGDGDADGGRGYAFAYGAVALKRAVKPPLTHNARHGIPISHVAMCGDGGRAHCRRRAHGRERASGLPAQFSEWYRSREW